MMRRKEKPGEVLRGNERYEGYCKDLADAITRLTGIQFLIKPVGQAWFGIPHVDLARGTTHEEVNHPFGFGGEMPIGESSGWTG